MSDYSIRKLSVTEFELLIPLMKDSFGDDVDTSYFQWKYLDNPSGQFVGFIATTSEGEVAAYYGVIPELYIIDNKETVIYQSCDTMTHSNHRRKGLFKKLASYCYEYLKKENKLFVIGFGGAQSTPGFIKMGWKELFDIRYYFYPRLRALFSSSSITEKTEYITDFRTLENAIYKSNGNSLIRSCKSLEIFKWRISNPKFNYKVVTLSEGYHHSYLCYYTQNDKLVVFDYYFKDKNSGKVLFKHLKTVLKKSANKGIIAFCQENSLFSKGLIRLGFVANPFKKGPLSDRVPFILYSTDANMKKFESASSWEITSFDHDSM